MAEELSFRTEAAAEYDRAFAHVTRYFIPAVAILKDYVAWGGNLQDREAPLFLAPRRKPCADNGKAWGGQNKTAFRAARKGSAIDFGRCG